MAEEREALVATLAALETVLIRSVDIAAERSPETFLEEAEALHLIISLRRELQSG